MSDLTNEGLLNLIDETLAWASKISEMWTGTLYEKLIDSQMAQLTKAVEANDLKDAYTKVHTLIELVGVSEEQYERASQ